MEAPLRTALVLGGAGFIGSHIVEALVRSGTRVVVVDGCIAGTGGRRENLAGVASDVRLIAEPVEEVAELDRLVRDSEVIIDAMAWTSHLDALRFPEKDLRLNAASHLALLRHLPGQSPSRVILLGSRGQYGNPPVTRITEDTPMQPEDIQGIHKVAAEGYFRVYAGLQNLNVTCLRLPNCFGERQRTEGGDIGLVGLFIRSLLDDKPIEVFGDRSRALAYAPDVAAVVCRLARTERRGFVPLNLAGVPVRLEDLARRLIACAGRGSYEVRPVPSDVARIDIGGAPVAEDRLQALVGDIPRSELGAALETTFRFFEGSRA